MANNSLAGDDAVSQLRSHEQGELLDAIDRLRRENIGTDIPIPQIVVCGDQSSGKSSVLEAIAQVRFPIGSGSTTRFPSEVVLRNASQPSIKVSLRAGQDRETQDKEYVENFRSTIESPTVDDFPKLVEEATKYLETREPERTFWNDWLCAEISGPTQPHLTLVDLPGLIHFKGASANAEDGGKIKQAVVEYLNNPRTVVLAVVSAMSDIELAAIMDIIENVESAKERTLGVITKPDMVTPGSDDEKKRIAMARNEPLRLGRGWHVLRNLAHEKDDRSPERRDAVEREFFLHSAWSQVPREDVGIKNLRQKLSRSLLACIVRDLPDLVSEMQDRLDDCNHAHDQLGAERETETQQREYLAKVLSKLRRLVECAVDGDYRKTEFATFFNGNQQKCLRDAIRLYSSRFADELRINSKQFHIYADGNEDEVRYPELERGEVPNFNHPYTPKNTTDAHPWSISFSKYRTALLRHMDLNQGKNLKGHLSDQTVQDIFRQQSVFWSAYTHEHVRQCFTASFKFMYMAVLYAAGRHTGEKLMAHYIDPAFDQKSKDLDSKVSELVWPYKKCHPMTYSSRFEVICQRRARRDETPNDTDESGSYGWVNENNEDPLLLACRALNRADAYYEIAIDTFIDNVATLAVERCLLDSLADLIPPEGVWKLEPDKLAQIAAEPEDGRQLRTTLRAQIVALDDVISTCRRHMRKSDDAVPATDSAESSTPQNTITYRPASAAANGPSQSAPNRGTGARVNVGTGRPNSAQGFKPVVGNNQPNGSTASSGGIFSNSSGSSAGTFGLSNSGGFGSGGFGSSTSAGTGKRVNIFGPSKPATSGTTPSPASRSLFDLSASNANMNTSTSTSTGGGIFGMSNPANSGSTPSPAGGLFGGSGSNTNVKTNQGSSIFGSGVPATSQTTPSQSGSSLFGSSSASR